MNLESREATYSCRGLPSMVVKMRRMPRRVRAAKTRRVLIAPALPIHSSIHSPTSPTSPTSPLLPLRQPRKQRDAQRRRPITAHARAKRAGPGQLEFAPRSALNPTRSSATTGARRWLKLQVAIYESHVQNS